MPVIKPKTSLSAKFKNAKRSVGDFFYDYGVEAVGCAFVAIEKNVGKIIGITLVTVSLGTIGFTIAYEYNKFKTKQEKANQRQSQRLEKHKEHQEKEQLLLQAFENKADTVTFSDGSLFGVVVSKNLSGDFFVAAHKPAEISPDGKIISMSGEAFMRLQVPAPK